MVDLEAAMNATLNTYVLGEHVASIWGLYPMVLWTPTLPRNMKAHDPETPEEAERDAMKGLIDGFRPRVLTSSGLYKVQGEAVQAIVGAAYHQFVRRWSLLRLCGKSILIVVLTLVL
jgi:hypothetical protein